MDVEIYVESNAFELNEKSTQKWNSVKVSIPKWGGDGAWCGEYLCIVERPSNPNSIGYIEDGISRTVELCYYNDLAKKWQDKDREWVEVTHWSQIQELPFHESILISREEMWSKINSGELRMIYNMKETDEDYQFSRKFALASVSFNEPLYYSSIRNNHIEDYMYAVVNKKNIKNQQ